MREIKGSTMKILDIPIGTKVKFKGTHGVCEEWAYGNCDKCILNIHLFVLLWMFLAKRSIGQMARKFTSVK